MKVTKQGNILSIHAETKEDTENLAKMFFGINTSKLERATVVTI